MPHLFFFAVKKSFNHVIFSLHLQFLIIYREQFYTALSKNKTYNIILIDKCCVQYYTVLINKIRQSTEWGETLEIIVSNKLSRPLYEQIAVQIKTAIMGGELKSGEAIPSVRSLAKSLHISVLTVQKAYATLQEEGFIETTAGKGCYVSVQNQDFYLEEQQKKIEEYFINAIEIARISGIPFEKLIDLLTLLYQEDD